LSHAITNNMGKRKWDTCFHGTSADHLDAILRDGLGGEYRRNRIWNVSNPHHTYWWSTRELAKHGEESLEFAYARAFEQALDNGAFALLRARDARLVVIEARIPCSWLMEDNSCDNMEGAVCTDYRIPLALIRSVRVSQDLSIMKAGLAYSCFSGRSSLLALQPTPLEQKVISRFPDDFFYTYEDIADVAEWTTVLHTKTKQLIHETMD
jgi:hypothetical protein